MTLSNLPLYCKCLLAMKATGGFTFAHIAERLAKPEVWTTALFFGQAKCDLQTASMLIIILSDDGPGQTFLFQDPESGAERQVARELVLSGLQGLGVVNGGMVTRGGTWDMPPKDPVLYRLYEVLVVYGWSYKALIAEKFGDGIMSAIGFRTSVEKKTDANGDRVIITLDGKWLPYASTDQWDMSLSH